MAIKVHSPEQYESSLRKLFPRGSYWDRQFADPQSDCSLFLKAGLEGLIRVRERMSDLQDESVIQTAEETLDDWERVSAGFAGPALPAERRRFLLLLSRAEGFNRKTIGDTGPAFGITVTQIELPFRPAFFGFSRFGLDRVAGPASFSALRVHASGGADGAARQAFENALSSQVLSNYMIHFIYGGA